MVLSNSSHESVWFDDTFKVLDGHVMPPLQRLELGDLDRGCSGEPRPGIARIGSHRQTYHSGRPWGRLIKSACMHMLRPSTTPCDCYTSTWGTFWGEGRLAIGKWGRGERERGIWIGIEVKKEREREREAKRRSISSIIHTTYYQALLPQVKAKVGYVKVLA